MYLQAFMNDDGDEYKFVAEMLGKKYCTNDFRYKQVVSPCGDTRIGQKTFSVHKKSGQLSLLEVFTSRAKTSPSFLASIPWLISSTHLKGTVMLACKACM